MQVARKLSPTIRVDPHLSFETFSMRRRFEATVEGDCFKIEFFLRHDDPYDLIRFERRRPRPFLGRQAFVPTPEDVIVQKLRWCARRFSTTPATSSPCKETTARLGLHPLLV